MAAPIDVVKSSPPTDNEPLGLSLLRRYTAWTKKIGYDSTRHFMDAVDKPEESSINPTLDSTETLLLLDAVVSAIIALAGRDDDDNSHVINKLIDALYILTPRPVSDEDSRLKHERYIEDPAPLAIASDTIPHQPSQYPSSLPPQVDVKKEDDDVHALHEACINGDLDAVKLLLATGADPSIPNELGWTALAFAVDRGHVEIVRRLLSSGAGAYGLVNEWISSSWNVLHIACIEGTSEIVKMLLDAGAKVDTENDIGWTALHFACRYGNLDAVKLLLGLGEDDKEKEQASLPDDGGVDDRGEGTLGSRNAPSTGHKAGSPKVADDNDRLHLADRITKLTHASEDGDNVLAPDLPVRGYQELDLISSRGVSGETPLHLAASRGHTDIVKLLLAACKYQPKTCYASHLVNARTRTKSTALTQACAHGNADTVRTLLAAGAEIHVRNSKGITPLMRAAEKGHARVVQMLLEHEAIVTPSEPQQQQQHEMDARGPGDWTPLHFAADRGRAAAATVLLEHGAKVDARTDLGYTSLYLACRKGRVAVVKILLEAGADVTLSDKNGTSPLSIAVGEGHLETVRVVADVASEDDRAAAATVADGWSYWEIARVLRRTSPGDEQSVHECGHDATTEGGLAEGGLVLDADAESGTSLEADRDMSKAGDDWVDVAALLDGVTLDDGQASAAGQMRPDS